MDRTIDKKRVWLWIIPLSLLWPLIHLVVFLIRFREFPAAGVNDILVFLPMSLISGIIFLLFWTKMTRRSQKLDLIIGYLLASPFAFLGSLLSGLVYSPPIYGTLIWGLGPLLVGMLIGLLINFFLAKFRRGKSSNQGRA